MALMDSLIIVLVAFLFAYLYANEKEFVFKWIWLFVAIGLVVFGLFSGFYLSQTVTTASNNNQTFTTNTVYSPDTNTYPFGTALAVLIAVIFILFIWRVIVAYTRGKG